jgi:CHAD domain-containing protein
MIVSTPWLDALRAHITAVQNGGSEEDVHQLRVATRRLASWLKLARVRILRSDLRWVRAAGGSVRDLDVMIAQQPPELLAEWLTGERTRRFEHLLEVVVAPIEETRARESVPRLARRVLDLGDQLQIAPNDVETFHGLRRSVRGLRYALEWLQEKTGTFKEFQDVSGRAADLSVALLLLDVYPQAALMVDYRRQLDEEFAARRIEAVGAWPGLRDVVAALA